MRQRQISIALAVGLVTAAALVLGAMPAGATVFSNPASITLNDPDSQSNGNNNATASPYPSTIAVSGLSGTVNHVAVTLNNVSYSYSQDLDVLLVGPGGQKMILVANLGPSGVNHAVSNGTLTLSDAGSLPGQTTPWGSSSTFKPVNFGGFNEVWEPPAPAGPYSDPGSTGTGATLGSVFNGTNPNGTWSLFVITTSGGDGTGAIAGGWSLDITTANVAATTTSVASNNNPSFTSSPGGAVALTATVHKASDASNVGEGTVAFTDGGAPIPGCAAVAVSAGGATCTTTFTTEGTHSIAAQYAGTANFGASNATLSQIVNNHTTVAGSNFCNAGSIALNNPPDTVADATPYASNLFVSGLGGTTNHVAVTLSNVTYSHSQDIDVLLVGPGGQTLILVANLGPDSGAGAAVSNQTVTFSDAGVLPPSGRLTPWSALSTVKPVNYGGFNELWGPPAPMDPYGDPGTMGVGATLASQFNGTVPNGTWSLYVITTAGGDGTGAIAGGWCASITSAAATAATTTTLVSDNNPSFTTAPGNAVTFTATVHKSADNSAVGEGTVAFTDGGTPIAGCGAVAVTAGTAMCATAFAGQGSHSILAQYSGSSNFGASSAPLSQVVNNHSTVVGNDYCNTGSIALNNPPSTVADATPYPSNIAVSGRPGNLLHLAVTLNDVSYSHSQDIDALLVGPSGQTLILVANLGPTNGPSAPASNSTLTLDDSGILPPSGMATPWGSNSTFKPVNYGGFNETWGPPAPPGPYGDPGTTGAGATLASQFNGQSPNGTWSLYVITTAGGDGTGAIAGGWCLNVTTPPPPVLTKSFSPTAIPVNGSSTLSFSIHNPSATASLSGVGFTDPLPAGLTVSTANGLAGTCGAGTITATPGSGTVSLSGGTLAASATCTFSVNVTATTPGSKMNTTSTVSSTEAGAGAGAAASATLNVTALPPQISKSFGAATVPLNGLTSLSFTVANPAGNGTATGVGFIDTLPAGLVVANPNGLTGTCGGGTITAVAGASSVSLGGSALAAGASCTFSVDVTATTAGVKSNSVTVSSTEGGTGNTATANVTVVAPPSLTKAFGAASVPLNGSTSLTFTASNPNAATALTGVGFTDNLPGGLVVATPSDATTTCGAGTVTATPGAGTVSLSGATLAASATCTFSVNVTGTGAGVKVNTTSTIASVEGGSGAPASATLTVIAPPHIDKAFGAATVPPNGTTSLTFSITNPNQSTALTGVAFTDTLPAGLVVTTPNGLSGTCGGGTITAGAGSSTVSLANATLAASGACTFSVNVTATAPGIQNNSVTASSTNGGTGNTATASLTTALPPSITKAFGAATIPLHGSTTLTFTITNPAGNVSLSNVRFTDNLPAGLVVASPNGRSGSCGGGTITAAAGSGTVSLSGATLATGAGCTLSVNVTGTAAGTQSNSVTVSSDTSGPGNTSQASVIVVAPPSITKAFGAATIPLHGSTTLTFTITNPAGNLPLTGVGFTDTLPAGLVVTTPNGLSGTCGGGMITAPAGSGTVSLSGATLATGAGCTFSVNVTGTAAGPQSNSVIVTSADGGQGNRSDASVTVLGPPTLAKSFGAASVPFGGSTALTFRLSNPNAGAVLHGVGFADSLPGGLVLATPNGLTGSCGGGTITAPAGSGTVSLSGATLAAGGGCTFSVSVTAVALGAQQNTTSVPTSTEGGAGGVASASVMVVKAPTTVTVTAAPSSASFGAPVTFTAVVVAAQANGSGVNPTGTVSFFLDGQAIPVAMAPLAGGQATFTTSGLGAGSHAVVAVYSGDQFFDGSTSAPARVGVSCGAALTTTHQGALILDAGTSTCLVNVHVTGSLIVHAGAAVDIEGSTIDGPIDASGPAAFRLCGSNVGGTVSVSGATGFVLVGDPGDDGCAPNRIGGSLLLKNNTHGLEAIGNHVAGAVSASGNSGPGPFPGNTGPIVTGNGP